MDMTEKQKAGLDWLQRAAADIAAHGREKCPVCGSERRAFGCYHGFCRDPQKSASERRRQEIPE